MSVLLFLTASFMVAPELESRTAQQFNSAFPTRALMNSESAAVEMTIWSDPDGRIYRCEATPLIGHQRYADHACDRLRNKRTVKPKSPDGTPAFGWSHTVIKYETSGSEAAMSVRNLPWATPEFTLHQPDLPDQLPTDIDVRLTAHVDSDGHIRACEARADDDAEEAAAIACQHLADRFLARMADREGNAVPFVAAFLVKLVKEPAEAL